VVVWSLGVKKIHVSRQPDHQFARVGVAIHTRAIDRVPQSLQVHHHFPAAVERVPGVLLVDQAAVQQIRLGRRLRPRLDLDSIPDFFELVQFHLQFPDLAAPPLRFCKASVTAAPRKSQHMCSDTFWRNRKRSKNFC
jgi:hypothetical protein